MHNSVFAKFAVLFSPAIVILLISSIAFFSQIFPMEMKSVFVLSLLLFFPFFFFLQGAFSAYMDRILLPSLLISSISFVLVVILFLNSTAYPYLVYYAAAGFFGYYLNKRLLKNRQ